MDIAQLLAFTVKNGASDLHLSAGLPPMIRVDGDVRRILTDMLARGYDGGISIEPHLAVVFHDESVASKADARFRGYVDYGRRLESMLESIRSELG